MLERLLVVFNYGLFGIVAAILISLQTSLWPMFFLQIPAPLLWIPPIIFWVQYRNFTEALLFSLIMSHLIFAYSAAPIKMIFLLAITITIAARFVRSRVLWTGPLSFATTCGAAALSYPIFFFLISFFFEDKSQQFYLLWENLLSPPLTAIFALPLYFLFLQIDEWTNKEHPKTAESEGL